MIKDYGLECPRFRELVTDYLEGAVTPTTASAMDLHKNSCSSCESFIGQIRVTVQALKCLKREDTSYVLPDGLLEAFRRWKEPSSRAASDSVWELSEILSLTDSELETATAIIPAREQLRLGIDAIEKSLQMGVVNPRQAVVVAKTAVEILNRLRKIADEGSLHVKGRLAEAWAVLGNARRIQSDFHGAREAFVEAAGILADLPTSSLSRARVLHLRSVYVAEYGDLREALSLVDEVISICRLNGDSHLVGRALISKGTIARSFGDSEISVKNLREGLQLIDAGREPRLELVAKHNLANALVESGLRRQALELLGEVRAGHARLGNPVDQVRLEWLEAKIAAETKDLIKAEGLLLGVKEYFVKNEMTHDAAVVSLDLAMVYLKQGRVPELKVLASEMATIFNGLGVQRELIAALAFFNKAKEIEQSATVGLLQDLIEALDATRQQSGLQPQLNMSS